MTVDGSGFVTAVGNAPSEVLGRVVLLSNDGRIADVVLSRPSFLVPREARLDPLFEGLVRCSYCRHRVPFGWDGEAGMRLKRAEHVGNFVFLPHQRGRGRALRMCAGSRCVVLSFELPEGISRKERLLAEKLGNDAP